MGDSALVESALTGFLVSARGGKIIHRWRGRGCGREQRSAAGDGGGRIQGKETDVVEIRGAARGGAVRCSAVRCVVVESCERESD